MNVVALEEGLARLRAATELATAYTPQPITRAQAQAILSHLDVLRARAAVLEEARDTWYAREQELKEERAALKRRIVELSPHGRRAL